MKTFVGLSAIAAAALLLCGCTFEYGTAADGTTEVPAIVMTNSRLVRVENGKKVVAVSADTIEMYAESKSWYGENVVFEGFNDTEQRDAAGTVPLLYANTDKEEYIMTGGVSLELIDDDMKIESGSLFWNSGTRLLSGDVSDRVVVTKTDGTDISGVGFQADGLSREFSFSRSIRGTIVSKNSSAEDTADGISADTISAGSNSDDTGTTDGERDASSDVVDNLDEARSVNAAVPIISADMTGEAVYTNRTGNTETGTGIE